MTVVVTHTTPADSTFSSTGAAAWNANHTLAGVGTMAEQDANNVAITGGTINGTTLGATTPAAGTFTTLTAQTEVLKGTGQNFLTYSQDFTNGAWSKARATISASLFTAPDGTTTANELVEDSTTNSHPVYRTLGGFINGITYTLSVYAKASGRTSLRLALADTAFVSIFADYNLTTVASSASGGTSTITSVGNGWYRLTLTAVAIASGNGAVYIQPDNPYQTSIYLGNGASAIYLWGSQLELGSTANTYIPTTTTAVYGTPTLSFSGVSTIGLQSDGSLYVQPAGTGAIQAQATTSSATGGNARGANAVDWQTQRASAANVASGQNSVIGGGFNNINSGIYGFIGSGYQNSNSAYGGAIVGGFVNSATGIYSFSGGGYGNTVSGERSVVIGGQANTSAGVLNYIGGGFTNSGTSGSVVTTQSGTMNGTTAVTLSGSNANIKVGQFITGTSIGADTYVSAISGTSLTLSKVASGSSTSTLSFFTPHGVVVGGGNNQATGSYSFIGGGGDAGSSANRNVASGDFSAVVGGVRNSATGIASFVGGGGFDGVNTFVGNSASGIGSGVLSGVSNVASGQYSCVIGGSNAQATSGNAVAGGNAAQATGGDSAVIGGRQNIANSTRSIVLGGNRGTTRSITGATIFASADRPIADGSGVSQTMLLVLGRQTTDATPALLTSDTGTGGSTTNQVILPNNSAYYFKGSVIANVTGAANGASWSFEGAIMRGANAASTVLIGTPAINRVAASSGATAWLIALTADTTNGGLAVTVTGAASTTIRWVCKAETTEVTF